MAVAVIAAMVAASVGGPASGSVAQRLTVAHPKIAAPAAGQPAAAGVVAPPRPAHPGNGQAAGHAVVKHAPAKPASAAHAPSHPKLITKHSPVKHAKPVMNLNSWHGITEAAAGHPHGGTLSASQKLLPDGLSGAQASMPVTASRAANAATITARALHLHMGLRSAVIAVATAMQESTLENLSYGDRDSLGLFQQRPSAGWGTPAQVTDPVYASDAFLHALAYYQHQDPAWASQPLWEAAQGVQRSGFPYAYAKWEDQAAHLVAAAARHLL